MIPVYTKSPLAAGASPAAYVMSSDPLTPNDSVQFDSVISEPPASSDAPVVTRPGGTEPAPSAWSLKSILIQFIAVPESKSEASKV